MQKIIIALISASNLMAIPNDSLIYKANKEYSEELYNDAIENYLKVIDNGYESSELYYNIGNSYFKINDMASAILYFEKAKKTAELQQIHCTHWLCPNRLHYFGRNSILYHDSTCLPLKWLTARWSICKYFIIIPRRSNSVPREHMTAFYELCKIWLIL